MKHTFCLRMVVAAILAVALPAFATTKTVTWSLPANWAEDVSYPIVEGYRAIVGEGLLARSGVGEVGEPDLPYVRIRIAMPSNGTFGEVTSEVEWEPVDLGGALPLPIAQPVPTGSTLTYPAPGEAYGRVYPTAVAKAEFLQIASGVHMMPIVVTPFKWDGPTKTLYRAKSLTVKATFDAPSVRRLSLSSASQTSQTTLRSMALSMTVNPDDATTVSTGLRLSSAAADAEANADYVIISPHRFVPLWQEFAAFRKTTEIGKSHNFFVKDCDEIYEAFKDVKGDDALKIHRYIEQLYNNGNGKIKYVVLGAAAKKYGYDNQTMVPARYVVCGGSLSQLLDMYYGCMDRLPKDSGVEVWDYDGDGAYLGHKNANGSYSQDSNAYIDWMQDLAVFRFPLMEEVVESGVKLTAGQIMTNFIAKIRRVESDSYPDRYSAILTGSTGFSTSGRGTAGRTEMYGLVVDEREFFDQGLNLFDPAHPSWGSDSEYIPRDHNFEFLTYLRGNRKVLMNNSSYSTCSYNDIYTTSGDFLDTVCHGWARGAVGAVSSGDSFLATGIYTIYDCAVPCDTGMYDYCPGGSYGITNCICVGEAPILAPKGGALASINNTRYGWSASWTTSYGVSELGMAGQHSGRLSWLFMRALSGVKSWSEGKGYQPMDAGMSLMWAHNMHGTPYASAAWGLSGAQVTGQGDPLAQLSVQHPRVWSPVGGSTVWSTNAANWTIAGKNGLHKFDVSREVSLPLVGKGSQTFDVDGAFSAAGFYVGQDAGATLTLDNTNGLFKVLRETVITNGNVCWKAQGGFGRDGIRFVGARGNIDLPGNAKRYLGAKFKNVGTISVSGGNVVIDTPRNATFGEALDYDEIEFVATNAADVTEWNQLRSRTPGIFKAEKRLRVVNSKLVLQTYNIGGSGSGNAAKPLVFATNATIKVQANPLWKEEYFVRPTYLHDTTLIGDYDKFAFGPNDGSGYDLYVSGKCAIAGTTPIKLNGTLRVHFLGEDAELEISNPLRDGAVSGTVTFDGVGKVRISGAQTFAGKLTVPSGVEVTCEIAEAIASSVEVEDGGILKLKAIPLTGLADLTIKSNGCLRLPAPTYPGTYKIVDATTTTLAIDPLAEVYDEKGALLEGEVTQGHYVLATDQLVWQASGKTWDLDPENTSAWKTESGTAAVYVDNAPLKFGDIGEGDVTVLVGTNVAPGFVNFRNTTQRYVFTAAGGWLPTITFNSLIAATPITFEVPLNVPGGIMATAGSSQFGDVTTPKVEIADGACVRATGTVQIPSQRVKKMRFEFSETRKTGERAAINELRLFNAKGRFYLPVGTVIRDIAGQKITIVAGTQGNDGQPVVGDIGDEQLSALIDGKLDGGNKWWASKSGSPTWFEITFPVPVEPVTGYSIRTADQESRDPKDWKVYAGFDEERMSLVATETGITLNKRHDWMKKAGATPNDQFPIGEMSGLALVREGGELVLDGTWCDDLDLKSGAVLKVVGTNSLSAYNDNNSLYLPASGKVQIDLGEADSVAKAFPILTGFRLTAEQFGRFECATDTAMLLLVGGDIYAATDNVAVPPYTATVSGDANWSTLVFTDKNKNSFTWANSNVKASGAVTLNVTADAVLTMDAVGTIASLTITGSGKLTVYAADGITPLAPAVIDDSDHAGALVWNLPIGSAAVTAGKDTTIGGGMPGTGLLTVGAGMKATQGEGVTFANRAVDKAGWLRFDGTRSEMDVGGLTDANYSFANASLVGSFERAGLTVKSSAGDCVRLIGTTDNFYGRSLINYDISGGLVELVPNGESCWFGQTATAGTSAATTFTQSGGIFRCLANGTSTGSGLVLGYQGGTDEGQAIVIKPTAGIFEVPDSFLNFLNPVVFHLKDNARLRAKGFVSSQSQGTIIVGTNMSTQVSAAVLEIGSLGFRKSAATVLLHRNASVLGYEPDSYIEQDVNVSGLNNSAISVTVAATNGASLALREMAFVFEKGNEIVVFGNKDKDWTGTVRIDTPTSLPKCYKLNAGVLDFGTAGASETASLVEKPANNARVRVVLTYDDYSSGAAIDVFRCGDWAKGFSDVQIREFLDLHRLDETGRLQPVSGGALKYLNGLINFIPEGGAGYVFPLSATISSDSQWTELDWKDRNGVRYTNDWTKVTVAELVCNGAFTVSMDRAITIGKLTTVTPSGKKLTIEESDGRRLSVTQIDDSGSVGTTVLHVSLGAGAVVKSGKALEVDGAADEATEHGTIQIPSGGTATIRNGLWNGKVEMADATASLVFRAESTLTSVPSSLGGATVGSVNYYANMTPEDGVSQFGSDTRVAADGTFNLSEGTTLSCNRFLTGLGNGTVQKINLNKNRKAEGAFIVSADDTQEGELVLANDSGSDVTMWVYPKSYVTMTNAIVWVGKNGRGDFHIGGTVKVKGIRNNAESSDGCMFSLYDYGDGLFLGSAGIDFASKANESFIAAGKIIATEDATIRVSPEISNSGMKLMPQASVTLTIDAPITKTSYYSYGQPMTISGLGRVILKRPSTSDGDVTLASGTLRLAEKGLLNSSKVVFGGGKMEVLLPQEEAVFTDPCELFMTKAAVATVEANTKVLVAETGSEVSGTFTKKNDVVVFTPSAITGITANITQDTDCDWTELAWKKQDGSAVPADVWSKVIGTATLNNSANARLSFSGTCTLSTLNINSSGVLDLVGNGTMSVSTVNAAGSTGTVRIGAFLKPESLTAGKDTVIAERGDYSITVSAGKKVTIPGWTTPSKVTGTGVVAIDMGARDSAVETCWNKNGGGTATNQIVCGTWTFTANAQYPNGKNLLVSGPDAVLKLTTNNDITGHSGVSGTVTVEGGGMFQVYKRDTFSRALCLRDGGNLLFPYDVSDNDRVFDLYGNAQIVVAGVEPSVIGGISPTLDSYGNPTVKSGIIAIRRSNLPITVADGSTLKVYSRWNTAANSGGKVYKQGGGVMEQYRPSGSALPFVVSAGTLRLVNDGTVTTAGIENNAMVEVFTTNGCTKTMANAISGSGALVKNGAGMLVLSGANTYSGATAVNAGTLKLCGASALSPNSAVTLAAGTTLDLATFRPTLPMAVGGSVRATVTQAEKSGEQWFTLFTVATGTSFGTEWLTVYDVDGETVLTDVEKRIVGQEVQVKCSEYKMPIVLLNNSDEARKWTEADWHDSNGVLIPSAKWGELSGRPKLAVEISAHVDTALAVDTNLVLASFAVNEASGRVLLSNPDGFVFTSGATELSGSLQVGAGMDLGEVSGGGTLVATNFVPAYAGLGDAGKWRGALRLCDISTNAIDFALIANAKSRVVLDGVTVANAVVVPAGYVVAVVAGRVFKTGGLTVNGSMSVTQGAVCPFDGNVSFSSGSTLSIAMPAFTTSVPLVANGELAIDAAATVVVNGVVRPAGTWNVKGGSIELPVAYPLTATLSDGGVWAEQNWFDANGIAVPAEFWNTAGNDCNVVITSGAAAVLTSASALSIGTVAVNGAGAVTLPTNLALTKLMGDGTVVVNNAWPNYAGLTDAEKWHGTIVIRNKSGCKGSDGCTLVGLGNVNSIVEMDNVSGWFNGYASCQSSPWKGTIHDYALKIGAGGFTMNDGSSNNGYCFHKLLGSGTFSFGKANSNPTMRFVAEDVSEFTGTISVVGNAGVTIGEPAAQGANGKLNVNTNVTLRPGQLWSAAGGIVVGSGAKIECDMGGLAGEDLARRAVSGVTYSQCFTLSPVTGNIGILGGTPTMPKGYTLTEERDNGYSVVVTAPEKAKFGVVSMNLHNGTALSGAGDHGLYPDVLENWGNLQVANNAIKVVSNTTFKISSGVSGWGIDNTPPDMIYKQYMDDSNKGETRTITITGVPYDRYRLIVYYSTDTANANFRPLNVNGDWYAGLLASQNVTNYTVKGRNEVWGHSGPSHNANAPAEGVNALVTDVYSGDVTLSFTRNGGTGARATPCAIQIVKVGEIYTETVVIDPSQTGGVIPVKSTNDVKIVCTWTNGVGEVAKLDLTPAYTLEEVEGGVTATLNPAGSVVVGDETIKVAPELTDADDEQEPLVVGEDVSVGVKSIPGLIYELMRGDVPGTHPDTAASERAKGPRTVLVDGDKPADKAFYIIRVGK